MGALLAEFAALGVAFRALSDGRLHASGTITDEARASIREHKAAILAELAANDPAPEQAPELRRLVAIVAADWPAEERAEALAAALADPADALTCFRALVAERSASDTRTPAHEGAMRKCAECLNLSPAGRCLAAWRGEMPGFARSYSPAMTDRPQRCEGYAPGPDDPDRCTGRERWPYLNERETR